MNALFDACCNLMKLVGKALGLSYKEVCVIGNLYAQGGVLWLAGLATAAEGVRLLRRDGSRSAKRLAVCGILNGGIATALFAWIVLHYRGGAIAAFDRCVDELFWLAAKLGISYQEVNIVIFVVGFLGVLALQVALLLALRRARRRAGGDR